MSHSESCCTACGCKCRSRYPAFTSREDDSDIVLRDIETLGDIIHHFRTVKSRRLRQLNAISSSTRNIPPEILMHIFRSVCSSASTTTTSSQTAHGCPQITLGAVSSHWRDVVRSAPELWRTFSVKITQDTLQNTLPLLQTYLDNNRSSFDAVRLDFASSAQYWSSQYPLPSLMNTLLSGETAPIIYAMDIRHPPYDWLPLILNSTSVKTLALYAEEIPAELPWTESSLTTLHLTKVPVTFASMCCSTVQP